MKKFVKYELIEQEIHAHVNAINHAHPSVCIFGSARYPETHYYFQQAKYLAHSLAQAGITVITGGGPGIMEAANHGAQNGGGDSCGFRIILPFEEYTNQYIDSHLHFRFEHFFTRKLAFIQHSDAFVIFPGGYGTLDELFECLVHIQNQKIQPIPIYLIGISFWKGLSDWIRERLVDECVISRNDADLFMVTDDIGVVYQDLVKIILNNV